MVPGTRPVRPCRVSVTRIRRSASGQGSGLSSTPDATLNNIVVAPTASANVRIAIAANPGWRRSNRRPYRTSASEPANSAPRSCGNPIRDTILPGQAFFIAAEYLRGCRRRLKGASRMHPFRLFRPLLCFYGSIPGRNPYNSSVIPKFIPFRSLFGWRFHVRRRTGGPVTIRQSEYTSTVLTSAPDIARLDADVNRLMPDRDVALSPHFALASLDDNWTPSVAVVSRRGAVAGIVFGKERRVGRFSSGLIYADGRLGHLAVSSPDECEAVLLTAIRSWFALPRIRGVRLAMAPSSLEARAIDRVREALALDLTRATPAQHELHSTLPLPPSYETFLTCLGTQTRRNFRYYRR